MKKGVSSLADMMMLCMYRTIALTLKLNGLDATDVLVGFHNLVYKVAAIVYIHDKVVTKWKEGSPTAISTGARDLCLNHEEFGVKALAAMFWEHILTYKSLDGLEDKVWAYVSPKLAFSDCFDSDESDLSQQQDQMRVICLNSKILPSLAWSKQKPSNKRGIIPLPSSRHTMYSSLTS